MKPSRTGPVFAAAALFGCMLLLRTAGGAGEADTEPVQALDDMPLRQLRVFLRGVPGDWRGKTPERRGLPEPASSKPVAADARRHALVDPSRFLPRSGTLTGTIAHRRSRRAFSMAPLTLEELSFLLWHTQGITGSIPGTEGEDVAVRAAPSAGARYPLETYVFAHRVEGLPVGLYRFDPAGYRLIEIRLDDELPRELQRACFGEAWIGRCAVALAWAAVPARTEWRYGPIAHRMMAFEAGHVAQNAYLAAEAMGMGACAVAAYHQPTLDRLLGLDGEDEFVLYLVALGHLPAMDPGEVPD